MTTAPPAKISRSPGSVDGRMLLEATGFDRRLLAVLITSQPNWQEILDALPLPKRQETAVLVEQLRQALGLDTVP